MNFPPIDKFLVLYHIIMRMLSGGSQARVVCKDANAVADSKTFEHFVIVRVGLAVFL